MIQGFSDWVVKRHHLTQGEVARTNHISPCSSHSEPLRGLQEGLEEANLTDVTIPDRRA